MLLCLVCVKEHGVTLKDAFETEEELIAHVQQTHSSQSVEQAVALRKSLLGASEE